MIDLGLSVKWAANNIGAEPSSTPESYYGNYYAWGETETKDDYRWDTYTRHTNGTYSSSNKNVFIKYIPTDKAEYWGGEGSPDNKLVLESVDDIATQTYGSNYRMPTEAELNELIALPNKWVTNFKGITGLNGRIFVKTQVELDGTFNDDTMLFIPVAGYFNGPTHSRAGSDCGLWSSSLNSGNPRSAWTLYFGSGGINLSDRNRNYGFSVRAVKA